jgi:DNA-binding transcriptional LysR family regulator
MNERQLPLLLTLATLLRERSVREAAHVLGVSPSVVSRRLAELRDWTGDPLFVRVGHEMAPTERALTIGQSLEGHLSALDRLIADPAPTVAEVPERRFVLACADAFLATLLPPVVRQLAQEAPRASLEVVPVEGTHPSIASALIGGAVDLYLGPPLGRSEGIIRRKVFDVEFTCILAEGHPALQAPLDLDAWCALDHLMVTSRFPARSVVDEALSALGRQRRVVATTPYFLGAVSLVAQTHLVAALPRRPAEAVAAGLGVRLVDPPLALPSVPIYLQWHVRLREDRGHSWLRERFTRGEAAAGPEEPAD